MGIIQFQRLKPSFWLVGYILPTLMINILSLSVPIVILQIYDRIVPNHALHTLKLLVFGALVAVLLEALFKLMRSKISLWQGACYEYQNHIHLFRKLLEAPISRIGLRSPGELLNEFNLVKYKKELFGGGKFFITLIDIPFVLIYLIFIFLIGGALVLVPLIGMAILLLSMKLVRSRMLFLIKEKNKLDDRRFNFINEIFTGLHTIKTHAIESLMLRRYEKLQEQEDHITYKMMIEQFVLTDLFQLVNQLCLVLMVSLGAIGVIQYHLTLGVVAACTILSSRCLQPIARFISIWEEYQKIIEQAERYDVVERLPQFHDLYKRESIQVQGKVELKNIRVGYGKQLVFDEMNLTIEPGELVYLTGPSFSGKTVLLKLINFECQPGMGQVFIDGQDVQSCPALLEKVTYIGPDTTLFQGTILENLNGFEGSQHQVEKINLLLTKFGLDPFIQQLPKGLQTELSNQSVDMLPKGVKHRLILVRTMLQSPKILLFDEANINLDKLADEFLIEFLSSLVGDVTIIVVSHRPSIRKLANRVYEIKNRQVIEIDS